MATRLNFLRIWAWLILFLTAFPGLASANSEWFTRVWQIDDGLLDNDVNEIVQGPDEYLWLVTPVGLTRFDGVHFTPLTQFQPTNNLSLMDFNGPHIRRVSCSREGVLWLTFAGGKILGLNPDFSIVSLNGKLPSSAPLSAANDANGALWLGYSDAIYHVQDGQIARLPTQERVSEGISNSLNDDGNGNIWLVEGNQIRCFQNGKFQPVASMEGVQCLAATRSNAVWLVANAHLFSCDINGNVRDYGAFQKLSDAKVVTLLEDNSGAVWIGTHGNGLFRYHESRFERMDTSHSSILSLAEDREGNIWVGTGGGGLNRISRFGIRTEALKNNQVQSLIQSICQDANGVLWGATQNGALVSRVGNHWQPVFTNAFFAGTVTCVTADRSAVWAGTRNGKLLRIVNTNYTTEETNIANNLIHGLLAASNGDIWIVGNNVLQRLHGGQIENIKLGRRVRGVYAITEDVAGNIWIGADEILLRFDGTRIVNETSSLQLAGHPICSLHSTEDGSLWIGSRNGGLMRWKGGQVGQIELDQGLMNDSISQIVADRRGWLWFGSNRGIFKLRKREVERAMEDHSVYLRPIVYGRNEGLVSQKAVSSLASPYILPQALLSHDERVWILTHAGVVVASPDTLPESTRLPSVLLTQVVMDGHSIASHDSAPSAQTIASLNTLNPPLKIPPSHRHLEFDFTAFHFRAPENLRFRYQLVGYDNSWIDAGKERRAAYSRLTSGDYQFRVQASVGDGPWSASPVSLDFNVIPFFWQTWWFRLGVLFVFTLSVTAIVRYASYRRLQLKLRDTEQREAIERERGRIARDIHDDLGNRLTEIQLLAGLVQRNCDIPKTIVNSIHEISSAARQATDALDEIIWAINPRNDTLPPLINYLGQFITDYLRTAGVHCRLDLPENPLPQSVSAEVRHNLFLAVKESLSNIARHANATEVSVVILATDKSLSVTIEDNGRGLSEEIKSNGADGLENMRRRIAEIGGEFQMKSRPGAGTSISFNNLWLSRK